MSSGDACSSDDCSRPVSSRSSSGKGGDSEREALECVLQATCSGAISENMHDFADIKLLREVAGRHAGRPLSLEPTVFEMVTVILASRTGAPGDKVRIWDAIARAIACTLWEDPLSRQRLQVLWDQLGESPT